MREEYDTVDVVRWRLKCEAQEWPTDHRRSNERRKEKSLSLQVLVLVLVFRLVLAFILLHLCFESRSSSWRERS